MQIAKPQVHLRWDNTEEIYMIHVVTWMDQTKFRADGYESLPLSATNGAYTITLKVKEDTTVPNMELLTPVVHTLTLDGISLDSANPFITVKLINTSDSNSEMGRRKGHMDDGDDSGMPTP